ncbi:MAG TPA: hypothetical protein VK788_04420, partial [Terriglobales bacterium]|nr:hypothetical protein [Terriglobales bacterium]
MRLNRRRSGKICSPSRIFVAMTLLMLLAAVALTMSSGMAKLQVADASDRTPTPFVASTHAPSQSPKQILSTFSHLPLMFEPNQGQIDASVKFAARGSGYGLYLTAQEAVLVLEHAASEARHPVAQTSAVSMQLVGANTSAEPVGDVQLPGRSNYFIGNDPAKWHRDIPQFARVRYRNVYP